jgi:Arc/MetJ-type ribon-helix-helix transcriptional regulator
MAKHRAGDRRIVSISIPEDLAKRLDRRVGKGREKGRSATISRMIQDSIDSESEERTGEPAAAARSARAKPDAIRIEKDTMGEVEVPADRYYGAQTARSLVNFDIGNDIMPRSVVRAVGVLKQAAAQTNVDLGQMDPNIGSLISAACDEVISGSLDKHFPLRIWQLPR